LNFEGVVHRVAVRHRGPAAEKVDRVVDVRIPHRLWRFRVVLDDAIAQSGDGASGGSVNLKGQQVIAADPRCPA
jgi:hypothetical protein